MESRGYGWVEACFVSLVRPGVPEGITRCVTLGAKRVIVGPHFFAGVLEKRIVERTQTQPIMFPEVELLNARYLRGAYIGPRLSPKAALGSGQWKPVRLAASL